MKTAVLNGAIPGPYPHTKAWNALRVFDPNRKGREVVIGASDAASACNVGYKSALQLYMEKRGEMPLEEDTDVSRRKKRMGNRIEPIILGEYVDQEGTTVLNGLPMFFSAKHPFMAATPDGFCMPPTETVISSGKTLRIRTLHKLGKKVWRTGDAEKVLAHVTHGVDAKNSTSLMFDRTGDNEHKYGQEGTDAIPLSGLFQGQQTCEVFGLSRVDFAVLKDGYYLNVYRVERNDELIQAIVSAEKELAERIIAGDPPEPNWNHPGTRRCLQAMHGCLIPGPPRTLPFEHLEHWLRLEALRKLEADAKEEREALTNRLLHAAGDAEYVEFEGNDELRLKRIDVADSLVTEEKLEALRQRIGQVDRRGHVRLQKVKRPK